MTGLDLTEAWDDDHATDKITLHLQRAYLSIVLGLASFGKHVARLRSWKETNRTAAFCVVSKIPSPKEGSGLELTKIPDLFPGMDFQSPHSIGLRHAVGRCRI